MEKTNKKGDSKMDEEITVKKSDVINAFILCLLDDPDDEVEDIREYAEDAANYFFDLLKDKA